MPSRILFFIALLTALLTFAGCASGLRETRREPLRRSERTVVLFLVDGFSVQALQSALNRGLMPNLRRHFLRGKKTFSLGQAAFPTQTYPNLASILTTSPIGEQPVVANHVVLPNGKLADYENAKEHDALRALVEPLSVFARLEAEGRESASFSYVLGKSASHHMRVGINEGLEYERHDYRGLDGRLLAEMGDLLQSRVSREWPDFIYVHLVGVDALAHRFGPLSPESLDYLRWLDRQLAPVFSRLRKGERGRKVVSLLTSDHGMEQTRRFVSLRKKMIGADLDLVVTNESRFLGLYLTDRKKADQLGEALKLARDTSGVELTAWKRAGVLEVEGQGKLFRFALGPAACGLPFSLSLEGGPFRCASSFDDGQGTYPFLVSQLARYFGSAGSADALVIAKPGVSFSRGAAGNHGGPTAAESLVPVLMRNASSTVAGPVPTSELLKVLGQRQAFRPTIENMKRNPTDRQARAQ